MLELPEVLTISNQITQSMVGKKVKEVYPPSRAHRLVWFNGNPTEYHAKLADSCIKAANGFGIFVEIQFDNGLRLNISDGVIARLLSTSAVPDNYQLAIIFNDQTALVLTVGMYGGIALHDGKYDNEYYQKSLAFVSPFSPEFPDQFRTLFIASKPNLSAKAFLATEQRFPGLGNGVLQDILLAAGIHPKRKIGTFTKDDQDKLLLAIQSVLREMTDLGGRDTETDLFGKPGGYATKLSRNTLATGCVHCHGKIIKEPYLGGAVYYCPACQPLG